MIDFETIFIALEQLLVTGHPWKTCSRKLLHWSDVPSSSQPALFITQTGFTKSTTVSGQPGKWTLTAKLYVYVQSTDQVLAATALNQALSAVDGCFTPARPGLPVNLEGLVQYCRIEGEVETDEGTLGDQAVAIVPISILTA